MIFCCEGIYHSLVCCCSPYTCPQVNLMCSTSLRVHVSLDVLLIPFILRYDVIIYLVFSALSSMTPAGLCLQTLSLSYHHLTTQTPSRLVQIPISGVSSWLEMADAGNQEW